MILPEKAITEFQRIWKNEFGKKINYSLAESQAKTFMWFFLKKSKTNENLSLYKHNVTSNT